MCAVPLPWKSTTATLLGPILFRRNTAFSHLLFCLEGSVLLPLSNTILVYVFSFATLLCDKHGLVSLCCIFYLLVCCCSSRLQNASGLGFVYGAVVIVLMSAASCILVWFIFFLPWLVFIPSLPDWRCSRRCLPRSISYRCDSLPWLYHSPPFCLPLHPRLPLTVLNGHLSSRGDN